MGWKAFELLEKLEKKIYLQYLYLLVSTVLVIGAYIINISTAPALIAMQITTLIAFYFMRLEDGTGNVGVIGYSVISYMLIYPMHAITESQIFTYIFALILPALVVVLWMITHRSQWEGGMDTTAMESYPGEFDDFIKEEREKDDKESEEKTIS